MSLIQRGDILAGMTGDGIDINVIEGITEMTSAYESCALLCLMAGNMDDSNTADTKKNEWLGNEDEPEENRLRSRFLNLATSGRPVSSGLINDLGEAAALDILDGFSSIGAVAVNSSASIDSANKITVTSKIEMKDGNFIYVKNEVYAQ